MKAQQSNLFEGSRRLQMDESIELTIRSLQAYGPTHKHWAIAWSGGKDSTALVTLVVWLITSGKIQRPETLTVLFADTRLEMVPLMAAAHDIMDDLRELGIDVRVVMAEMDQRYFVYLLGRGVPPPNNGTLRWCTAQIKIEPMEAELRRLFAEKGEKVLMLTGVRQGESAMRDQRIVMSCGKDGAECGQGWYQETLPTSLCDTLAPLLHWRVCHIWEWLRNWAPRVEYGDWSTKMVAEAYGGDEAEEKNARTGCMGCPLASKDMALENLTKRPQWAYLSPLLRLKPMYRWLRLPSQRLRQPGGEKRKDGSLTKNQQRMGPLTMEARLAALDKVLGIQAEVNQVAEATGRPRVDILNPDEEARIRELIANNTWPQKWTGEEPTADIPQDVVYPDGYRMNLLDFMKSAA
ncbi:phosphoadenosine phosphosulfate reductase family protein [Hymenobacter sediminicola]|uniref:Phosphoadenosine phosphosulfate reductase family protein n=1 Tax=Hymenobacter sediminicola TaxID=2761579 RepID=A0A7G7W2Y1_9BACT|nr:phosphoadenosine phosphosulfate reductase family protein [Hymenobacter sediminicola]QNH60724.1 phosphoadenosine phosphosulfate reductase family protein [Hymenobacter sediminicola]